MFINRQLDKNVRHIHNGIFNSAIKKDGILPFATWMDLKDIMVCESVKERQILYDFISMQNLKKKVNEQTK